MAKQFPLGRCYWISNRIEHIKIHVDGASISPVVEEIIIPCELGKLVPETGGILYLQNLIDCRNHSVRAIVGLIFFPNLANDGIGGGDFLFQVTRKDKGAIRSGIDICKGLS